MEVPSEDFKQRLYRLHEVGINYDCQFIVGTDCTLIEGHKFLFAIASDVFKAMFYGKLKEDKCVRIEDLDPVGFESMKRFVYTGEVRLESIKHAFLTYLAAHRYLITDLKDACFKHIETEIEGDKILEFYEWCQANHLDEFNTLCSRIVTEETNVIVTSAYFLNSKPDTIEMILKSPSLCLLNELSLFSYFERWATAEAERENVIQTNSEHTKKQMSSYFDNIKKHVRFLTMSEIDLRSTVAKSPLLTANEKQAICGYVLMNLDTKLLPDSISPIVEKRHFRRKTKSGGIFMEV